MKAFHLLSFSAFYLNLLQGAWIFSEIDENDKIGGKVPRNITIGYGLPSDIVFDPVESTIIIQTSDTTVHVFKVDVLSKRLTVHSWREVFN